MTDDGVLVGVAAAAALAAGLMAVAQHANCTSVGYELAVAERENLELSRGVERIERRASALRTPQAATARAAAMKLSALKYPKTWNVVTSATVASCVVAPTVAPSTAPTIAVSAKAAAR